MAPAAHERLPPAYWRLLTASGISNLGDGVFLAALPLLAAQLTRDEISISLIAAFSVLPWLLFSLPIGALIDRADRRRIMIGTDTFRAAVVGLLTLFVALDMTEVWMLWAIALALGIAEVFFDNAAQALVPAIVPAQLLEKANGRMYAVELSANTFVGTPIGPILLGVSLALPFGVEAASYAVAVMLVLTIGGNFNPNTEPRQASASLYAEMRTGVRWLWRHPLLRTLAIVLGLSNLAFQLPQAVFVLFALEELGVSERQYGLMLGVMGVGAVLGSLLGDRLVAHIGQAACIYGALITWVVTLAAVGLYPHAWFVALAVSIESMAAAIWNVVVVSLRQQIIPAPLFGRVNSVYRWFAWGTLPIASVLGGLVAHFLGLRATYLVGAAVMALAVVAALRHVNTTTIVHALAANRVATGVDATPVAFRDEMFDI
jgi:MFS family permease